MISEDTTAACDPPVRVHELTEALFPDGPSGEHAHWRTVISSPVFHHRPGASDEARERIGVLEETNDGFAIAEKDLELRGPGEFLGVRQHGLPRFSVADLGRDSRLLLKARDDAFSFLDSDRALSTAEGRLVNEAIARRFRERGSFMDVG